ncbi:GNAT family N-acetyltransferase [Pantoea agglomerans]|uniref:GNAT family N-acetyltransferase n=1 Tax=Enterobacter agglomerans TaxID=549 RepID=UPI003209FDF1
MELIKLTAEHIKEMYDIRFSVTENIVHAHQIEYLQKEVILADVAQDGGWICRIDDKYVGYGLGIHIPHALIGGLFVLPEYQGRGVGGAILEKITEWFFEQGDTEIELTTDEHSSAARFYQGRGWHSCGHDEYGQLIMKKRKLNQ